MRCGMLAGSILGGRGMSWNLGSRGSRSVRRASESSSPSIRTSARSFSAEGSQQEATGSDSKPGQPELRSPSPTPQIKPRDHRCPKPSCSRLGNGVRLPENIERRQRPSALNLPRRKPLRHQKSNLALHVLVIRIPPHTRVAIHRNHCQPVLCARDETYARTAIHGQYRTRRWDRQVLPTDEVRARLAAVISE